jgi:hypothetical protein
MYVLTVWIFNLAIFEMSFLLSINDEFEHTSL